VHPAAPAYPDPKGFLATHVPHAEDAPRGWPFGPLWAAGDTGSDSAGRVSIPGVGSLCARNQERACDDLNCCQHHRPPAEPWPSEQTHDRAQHRPPGIGAGTSGAVAVPRTNACPRVQHRPVRPDHSDGQGRAVAVSALQERQRSGPRPAPLEIRV
jgi:hypothetical protein